MKRILSLIVMLLMAVVSFSQSDSKRIRSSVENVNGWLRVFPYELGTYESYPRNVIDSIRAEEMFDYKGWRLPTCSELDILRENGYLSDAQYMCFDVNNRSQSNYSGVILLVTSQKSNEEIRQSEELRRKRQEEIERQAELERQERLRREGFIDLGLSSGTYWRNSNEGDDTTYYNSVEASRLLDRYPVDGRRYPELPNKGQIKELKEECIWTWTGNGYTVVGPNGNSIFLPAAGFRNCDGNVGNVGIGGYYQLCGSDGIYFNSENVEVYSFDGCRGRIVRLVYRY